MNSSTRDKIEGKFREVKGKIKETAGKLSGNRKLEAIGVVEKITGQTQEKIGQLKNVIG